MITALKKRWFELCSAQNIPNDIALWDAISTMYAEHSRAYHNLDHISDCLQKLDQWPDQTHKVTIEVALWLHDIIFDTKRTDNESASAGLARHYLGDHPLAETVFALILATRHHATQINEAEFLICDIDLSILGTSQETYQLYAKAIRTEFAWVPESMFLKSRINVLSSFMSRKSIFYTDFYKDSHEACARRNIICELEELNTLLKEHT